MFQTLQQAGDKARIEPKFWLYATKLPKTFYGANGIYQRHVNWPRSYRLGCGVLGVSLSSCRFIQLWTTSEKSRVKCYFEELIIKSERWKVSSLPNGCLVKEFWERLDKCLCLSPHFPDEERKAREKNNKTTQLKKKLLQSQGFSFLGCILQPNACVIL